MSDLKPGMKVLHALFGAGTVRAISGSGPDAKITVDFSSAVGQKKLIASVANLKTVGEDSDYAPTAKTFAWFEVLEASAAPKPGRRPPPDKLYATLNSAIRHHEFWMAVRERMRAAGSAPRVLDEPSGNVSLRCEGLLRVRIVIRHGELVRVADAKLSRAIFDTLEQRYLPDFQPFAIKLDVSVQHTLDEAGIVTISDEELSDLPDRDPRRRPLPVTPKGVIKSRPKRHDDY